MKKLLTPFGSFNIYINRLLEEGDDIFHISFIDKNNKAHIIHMQQGPVEWDIINPDAIESWIVSLRAQLQELITMEIVGECDVLLKKTG
jgi:hypothetical protein